MHWLLGSDKSSSESEASTGEEDIRDICWAALCAGMKLSDERCQHLRVMLTAWYLVEVWLGEAGVFAERLQIVKASGLHVLAISICANSVCGCVFFGCIFYTAPDFSCHLTTCRSCSLHLAWHMWCGDEM